MSRSRLEAFSQCIKEGSYGFGASNVLEQLPDYWSKQETNFWQTLVKGRPRHVAVIYNAILRSFELADQAAAKLGVEKATEVIAEATEKLFNDDVSDKTIEREKVPA